jgi:hypothetical protein
MSRLAVFVLLTSLFRQTHTNSAEPDVAPLLSNRLQSALVAANANPNNLPNRVRLVCILQNRAVISEMLKSSGRIEVTTLQDTRRDQIHAALLKISKDEKELSVWPAQKIGPLDDRLYWVWVDVTPRLLKKAVDQIVSKNPQVEVIDVSEKTIGTTKAVKIPGNAPEPFGKSYRSIVAPRGGEKTLEKIGAIIGSAHNKKELELVTLTGQEAVVACTPAQLKKLSTALAKIDGAEIRRVEINQESRNPLHLKEATITDPKAKGLRETLAKLSDKGYEFPVSISQQKGGSVLRARISKELAQELATKGFKVN